MDHPHRQPDEVEQRKNQLLIQVAWYCLALHASLIGVFLYVGVELLAAFNVLSVATWWFGIRLLEHAKQSLALRIFSLEVTAHSILVTAIIGIPYGFQFYLWAASCLLLLDTKLKLTQAVVWCAAIIIAFASMYWVFTPPPYQLEIHDLAPYVHFINVVVCGIPMIYTIGLIREITINQRVDLQTLAAQDPLTHLFNRRYAHDLIHQAAKSCRENQQIMSVIMADIDHFKRINDLYGHERGDEVIRRVANCISHNLKEADIGVRWGGEEFLIVLPNCTLNDAQHRMEMMRQEIEAMAFKLDELEVTMSFGLTTWLPEHSFEETLKRADLALYQSKHKGRNRLTVAPV